MPWEVAFKNLVLDSGTPATVHIALFNGDPTTTGGVEVTLPRQSAALGTAASGIVSNTANVVFTATGNEGNATHAAGYSAATGGSLYISGALSATRSMVTGATLTFVTGAIDIAVTG